MSDAPDYELPSSSGHCVVVLAAGGSSRLGAPKQLLTQNGEALAHRAARLGCESGAQRVVVVLGAHHREVAATLGDLRVELVINHQWREGLASTLKTAQFALGAQPGPGPTLILGCDQVALTQEHIERLLAGAATLSSGLAATVHSDGRLGLPTVLSPTLMSSVGTLEGDSGFGAILNGAERPEVWRLSAPELRFDIDTVADVSEAVSRGLLDDSG